MRDTDTNQEPSASMVKECIEMARTECKVILTEEQAELVVRRILRTAHERDDFYRVSTKRLDRLAHWAKGVDR